MDAHNLNLPEHYINRELSVLEFQRRVLAMAGDAGVPLLERLKFLCIVSTNLDEFFEIRVSGLKQRREAGAAPPGPELMSAQQALREVAIKAGELVSEQYRLLNDEIIPGLQENGIHFIRINSASYLWLPAAFKHESYSKDIHKEYPWIARTAPYREPLWALVEVDLTQGRLTVTGKETDWVGPSPWKCGVDEKEYDPEVRAPRISDMALSF